MTRSIPDEIIRRVKHTANIVDFISEHVVLKKTGRNYQGLCPFHTEKTPSFTVSPERQMFYCFGCHTGGDVINFAMQYEGIAFSDAVRVVAGKYSIEVPQPGISSAQKAVLTENERLQEANEEALRYFQDMLKAPDSGQRAMSYLLGRGMTRKIIDAFQIGYAPARWDGLLRHLQRKRVTAALGEKAGVVIPRKNAKGHYDRFRDRIIFPIHNLSRRTVGFGGRVMGDELPKYLNSPETPLYNKRRCLYGLHLANRPVRSQGRVYVVEGYFDVLAMHLYGLENCVATLGTALTPEHAQLLKGMVGQAGKVFLVFDSDQAGIKAAARSVTVFEAAFLDVRVMVLPRGHDPDTFLREFGPDDFMKRADKALGMIPFIIESAIAAHGLSLEGKIKVVNDVQEALAAVNDSVAKALHIKYLAERLQIDESAIHDKIHRFRAKSMPRAPQDPREKRAVLPVDSLRMEQQLLAMILCYPQMIPDIVGRNLLDYFEDETLKQMAHWIVHRGATEKGEVSDLISRIENPDYRNLLAKIAMTECHWDRQGCERVLGQFQARYQRRDRQALQRRIEAAEKSNDMELLSQLLMEKQRQAGQA
ncbi:MAG: DNA primase [Desulfatitalea sp.]|nr:DNA primase [Desulfatitalea sp.]NNJ99404.1 DNA primase [Desulfatitalea sp.]